MYSSIIVTGGHSNDQETNCILQHTRYQVVHKTYYSSGFTTVPTGKHMSSFLLSVGTNIYIYLNVESPPYDLSLLFYQTEHLLGSLSPSINEERSEALCFPELPDTPASLAHTSAIIPQCPLPNTAVTILSCTWYTYLYDTALSMHKTFTPPTKYTQQQHKKTVLCT